MARQAVGATTGVSFADGDGAGATAAVVFSETREVFAAAAAAVRKHQVEESLHLRVAAVVTYEVRCLF